MRCSDSGAGGSNGVVHCSAVTPGSPNVADDVEAT